MLASGQVHPKEPTVSTSQAGPVLFSGKAELEGPSLSFKEVGWGWEDLYQGSTCCGCSNASGIKGPKIAVLALSLAGVSLGELAASTRPLNPALCGQARFNSAVAESPRRGSATCSRGQPLGLIGHMSGPALVMLWPGVAPSLRVSGVGYPSLTHPPNIE